MTTKTWFQTQTLLDDEVGIFSGQPGNIQILFHVLLAKLLSLQVKVVGVNAEFSAEDDHVLVDRRDATIRVVHNNANCNM